ncbi:glycoside hydrolase family 99-like domain-containing protein [Pseudomonas farris]
MKHKEIISEDSRIWENLRYSLFVSEKYKLLYVSTPKVACTSLKWWFAALEGVSKNILNSKDSSESDPELIIHDTFHTIAPRVAGRSFEEMYEPLNSEEYFRFAVVRNPFKRIFSAWQSKILLKEPLQINKYKDAGFLNYSVESRLDVAKAFEAFLEYLAKYEAPNFWDVHWTPQYTLLNPSAIDYSMISKIEDISNLRVELASHLGGEVQDPFGLKPANESLIPYRQEFFTARSEELVRSLYKKDFEFFGYEQSLPLDREELSDEALAVALKAIGLIKGRHQRLDEIRSVLIQNITVATNVLSEKEHLLLIAQDDSFNKDQRISSQQQQIVLLEQEVESLNYEIACLKQGLADLKLELRLILSSKSWWVTKPFRCFNRIFCGRAINILKNRLGEVSRVIWHKVPISGGTKLRIKNSMFTRFPFAFSWTQAYRSWYGMNFPGFDLPSPATSFNQKENTGLSTYVPLLRASAPKMLPVRLIAFYLPQFHAIKENNEWWGDGFTEWTNVKPAQPQFEGHYQPHVPGELGYYNLLDRSTQQRQIELAKLYGIGGFCFYYYWFAGQRLLEQPIENYLADSTLDHPFCLCWANENWSRRWDGKDSEILIAQQHSPEDDLAFAADVARYMKDDRYIRVDGKPLLIVYRPSLLPSALETSQRWREWFRENGVGEIYLAYTQSFEVEDPRTYGFNAAIEFPPNNSAPPNITSQVKASSSFGGTVYDWSVFLKRSQNYKKTAYRLFRSVCPSWDNTARRKSGGTVFLNSTPNAYQAWLENAVAETCQQSGTADERLVFVNAWNEWAEGAHLEPDAKYGYAWLDATRRALTGEAYGAQKINIAVISHDAHPHGAQFLALGMVRSLVNDLKLQVHTVLLGEGRLRGEFAQCSPVYDLPPGSDFERRSFELARELAEKGIQHAIVNTTVSGSFVEALTSQGIRCVSLIHEMPGVIEANNLSEQAKDIARFAHRIVFPASIVEDGFAGFADADEVKKIIRPQGLWRRNLLRFNKDQVRKEVRERFGMAVNAPIVLAVGYADRRKGVDLFVKAALEVLESKPDALFIWIGHWDDLLRLEVDVLVKEHVSSFKFLGYEPDTASYHAAADVYALTSREDPFPNVVLESFDAGVPVVAFEGSGGGAKLVSKTGGRVVPMEDVSAFAQQLVNLINQPETAQALGEQASSLVDRDYAFRSYLFDLCEYSGIKLPRVSVVVPNYNYAQYIEKRLDSILNQSLPIYELIILDDASTDESVFEIKKWLSDNKVECRLIVNEENSGCVFDQWAKGVALASGDFVWIAEADDLSASDFLETVIAPMERDCKVSISYCESQQIDGQNLLLSNDYQAYRQDICSDHWQVPYVADGDDEVIKYMAVKNTIPNVSGVIFKRQAISDTFLHGLAEIRSLSKAGDWLTYIKTLKGGKIAFTPRPLNFHRRHSGSVIGSSNAGRLLEEIAIVQGLVASEYSLSSAVALQAKTYTEELRRQFSKYNQVSK